MSLSHGARPYTHHVRQPVRTWVALADRLFANGGEHHARIAKRIEQAIDSGRRDDEMMTFGFYAEDHQIVDHELYYMRG